MNPTHPTIRCLIVDDEELARTLLKTYADRLPNLQVIGQCKDPIEAISVMQQQPIDLLFLDIQMPKMNGIDFLKILTTKTLVIFTTAYQQHAIEGFALDALDYLLKPIPFERFVQAVNKASDRLRLQQLAQNVETIPTKDFIIIKSEHKLIRLRFDDILFIEGMREYVAFHTNNGRILSLYSLTRLETELPPNTFIRIHKSFIAGTRHVTALETGFLQVGTKKLPIGANYRDDVKTKLF